MPAPNIHDDAAVPASGERFDTLLRHRNLQVERIISSSDIRPVEYVQEQDEWVLLVQGSATLLIGTHSHGQGHETVFRQLLADRLGLEFEEVRIIQGDTDRIPVGGGSHSGRSMRMAGFVMGKASDAGRRVTLLASWARTSATGSDFAVASKAACCAGVTRLRSPSKRMVQ